MESGYLKINVASVKDNRAAIYFKYNETAVSILKSAVPGSARRFCRENRTWSVDIRSFPELVKTFTECSIGGMYYECSSLVTVYRKFCEKNGIENDFSRLKGWIPLQPDLFGSGIAMDRTWNAGEILPEEHCPDEENIELKYPEGTR